MERKIRWGLLGAGDVLNRWMPGVCQLDDMEIVGIASRHIESAKKMGEKWHIKEAMSYEDMVSRDDIDVVYISTTHNAHKELAMMAMNAGKSVLVEKPAAINAIEFAEMMDCAKKNQVFLMEAMWSRFNPLTIRMLEMIKEGRIGEVRAVQTSFCFRLGSGPLNRLTDPARAGGGLLDTGVYNLHFAEEVYGKSPVNLIGTASIGTDEMHLEVDELAGYVAQYDKGEMAIHTSGIRLEMPQDAYVYGTKGYIHLPNYWHPTKMNVVIDGVTETIESILPQKCSDTFDEGYRFEIMHVNECLRKGMKESDMVPLARTLSVLKQCDKLRADWKLVYPFEK